MSGWLQVGLNLAVPAVAALAGVWLGSRLSAASAKQQWRRDRLLEFCVELITACHEVVSAARSMHEEIQKDPLAKPPYPRDAMWRTEHAQAAVRLLSVGLALPAINYVQAVQALVKASLEGDKEAFRVAHRQTAELEGIFERNAHDVLSGIERPLTPRDLRGTLLDRISEQIQRRKPRD